MNGDIPTLTDFVYAGSIPSRARVFDLSKLSAREKQVLQLFAMGHRNKDVASQVCISPKTVETYKKRIKAKFAIKTTVEWMTLLRALPGATA